MAVVYCEFLGSSCVFQIEGERFEAPGPAAITTFRTRLKNRRTLCSLFSLLLAPAD